MSDEELKPHDGRYETFALFYKRFKDKYDLETNKVRAQKIREYLDSVDLDLIKDMKNSYAKITAFLRKKYMTRESFDDYIIRRLDMDKMDKMHRKGEKDDAIYDISRAVDDIEEQAKLRRLKFPKQQINGLIGYFVDDYEASCMKDDGWGYHSRELPDNLEQFATRAARKNRCGLFAMFNDDPFYRNTELKGSDEEDSDDED